MKEKIEEDDDTDDQNINEHSNEEFIISILD